MVAGADRRRRLAPEQVADADRGRLAPRRSPMSTVGDSPPREPSMLTAASVDGGASPGWLPVAHELVSDPDHWSRAHGHLGRWSRAHELVSNPDR